MNGNCLDIGTIQAFLDGETRPEQAVKISEHVADCDTCTLLLAQAEEESSLVFSVLDRELNSLVPTQRLWSRINAEIAVEKTRGSVWNRIAGLVSASLLNPSFASAAGILMVVGMAGAVWVMNTGDGGSTVAVNQSLQTEPAKQIEVVPDATDTMSQPGPTLASANDSSDKKDRVRKSNLSDSEVRRIINANYVKRGPKEVYVVPASAQYLPGEEIYVRTINELQQSVSIQNASASSQVSYARDMAVVDDSIRKMRQVVKKNPRNQAAKQVLYSSYQDKIEILKSSAGRDELLAIVQ